MTLWISLYLPFVIGMAKLVKARLAGYDQADQPQPVVVSVATGTIGSRP